MNRLRQRVEALQIKGASFNEAILESVHEELAMLDEAHRQQIAEVKSRVAGVEERVLRLEQKRK